MCLELVMATAAVVPALVMPYETFMNDLAKSVRVTSGSPPVCDELTQECNLVLGAGKFGSQTAVFSQGFRELGAGRASGEVRTSRLGCQARRSWRRG